MLCPSKRCRHLTVQVFTVSVCRINTIMDSDLVVLLSEGVIEETGDPVRWAG